MIHFAVDWLAGFGLRVVQVLVESSLYLLIGFLTAGMLRGMVGPERIRRYFGTGRTSAPLRAWVAATAFLPVCALGVLPVLRELRRAGVPRHAVLTFALTAPMLNPISLISCLSYLGPNLLVVLMGGSMIVAGVPGILMGDDPERSTPEPTEIANGSGRLSAAAVLAARAATGSVWADIAAGVLGASVMAASLPQPTLADSFFEGDHWAIGRMMVIAPLTYATPDKAMVALPEMVKFRQSAGVMFTLVALGVGLTLGQVTWAGRTYGIKATLRWVGLIGALTLVVAYAVAGVVPAVGTANADNDHFNDFGNPFHASGNWPDLAIVFGRFAAGVAPIRWATVGVLAGLMGAGFYWRRTGNLGLATPRRTDAVLGNRFWERPVPPWLASAVGASILGAVGIVGLYAYFPPPAEIFEDMNIIKADFFGELSWPTLDPARHHLDLWERQAAKLGVGSLIRFQPVDDAARHQTEELQAALQNLRATIDANHPGEARALSLKISQLQSDCRAAYHVAW